MEEVSGYLTVCRSSRACGQALPSKNVLCVLKWFKNSPTADSVSCRLDCAGPRPEEGSLVLSHAHLFPWVLGLQHTVVELGSCDRAQTAQNAEAIYRLTPYRRSLPTSGVDHVGTAARFPYFILLMSSATPTRALLLMGDQGLFTDVKPWGKSAGSQQVCPSWQSQEFFSI